MDAAKTQYRIFDAAGPLAEFVQEYNRSRLFLGTRPHTVLLHESDGMLVGRGLKAPLAQNHMADHPNGKIRVRTSHFTEFCVQINDFNLHLHDSFARSNWEVRLSNQWVEWEEQVLQ